MILRCRPEGRRVFGFFGSSHSVVGEACFVFRHTRFGVGRGKALVLSPMERRRPAPVSRACARQGPRDRRQTDKQPLRKRPRAPLRPHRRHDRFAQVPQVAGPDEGDRRHPRPHAVNAILELLGVPPRSRTPPGRGTQPPTSWTRRTSLSNRCPCQPLAAHDQQGTRRGDVKTSPGGDVSGNQGEVRS